MENSDLSKHIITSDSIIQLQMEFDIINKESLVQQPIKYSIHPNIFDKNKKIKYSTKFFPSINCYQNSSAQFYLPSHNVSYSLLPLPTKNKTINGNKEINNIINNNNPHPQMNKFTISPEEKLKQLKELQSDLLKNVNYNIFFTILIIE